MYQGYGGWSPWGGGGGGGNRNANPQQGQQGQVQQHRGMNQAQGQQQGVGQMQQFQTQQQHQPNMMGYGGVGMGTGANSMMIGYPGMGGGVTTNVNMMGGGVSSNSNMMGMAANSNMMGMGGGMAANSNMMGMGGGMAANTNMMGMGGGMAANTNMMGMGGGATTNTNMMGMTPNLNNAATGMMGLTGTNAHLLSMSGTSRNVNMLGMNAGNQFGNNSFGNHQQNQYSHQQIQQNLQLQQQNSSQSLYQTQPSFARPQPPLPPGPPPMDQLPRDVSSKLPLFNNMVSKTEPPTPVPPPLPKEVTGTRSSNPPPPPPDSRNQHNIPEHVLRLLKTAEDARILETAENCPQMTPSMTLNVSHDLFGTSSDSGKKAGIPGLDFGDGESNKEKTEPSEAKNKNEDDEDRPPDRVERINFETMQVKSGDRKLDQKPSSEWNLFNRNNRNWRGNRQNETKQIQDKSDAGKSEDEPKVEIKWELRSEIDQKMQENVEKKEINISPELGKPKLNLENVNDGKTVTAEKSSKNGVSDNKSGVEQKKSLVVSPSNKSVSSAVSDSEIQELSSVAASIPLGSGDKPVEYDRKTLRAFDKKFREWETQFDNWKISNDNHPDKDAYNKYMDQWNLWRQQLIEQRRFILDSMNKARMEGNEIAFRKSIAQIDESTATEVPKPSQHSKNEERGQFVPNVISPSSRGQPGPVPPPPISNAANALNPNKSSPALTSNKPMFSKPVHSNVKVPSNSNIVKPLEKILTGTGQNSKNKNQPPSLMSMSVDLPSSNKNSVNSPAPVNNRSDNLVERIPRDRDRPDFQSKSEGKNSFGKSDSELRRDVDRSERVSRDPHEQQKELFQIEDTNVNPWAMPTKKPDKNPFEVAENEQNPFVQAASQNPWNQPSKAEDNLPKLSDFLQKDTFGISVTQNMNYNRFGTGGGDSISDRVRRDPGMSRNQKDPLEGVKFEHNPGGMPLLTATKPQPTPTTENKSSDLSQWFTRDRRGAFEEEEPEDTNDYEIDAPAVIDYGHGSGEVNEEDEFDLPRGERPILRREPDGYSNYQDEGEDEDPQDVVTIDYGHGSIPPQMDSTHGYPLRDNYYDEYYDEYEDYQQRNPPAAIMQRGRGIRGRGRGGYDNAHEMHHPSFHPTGPGYGLPSMMRGRGMAPDMGNRLYPNRGGGRGGPARFPVSDIVVPGGYIERPAQLPTRPRPRNEAANVREESPEIIILTPPRKPRLAPPLERMDGERKTDRIARDSGRGGQETSHERDNRSRRIDRSRSRSRDRDEPYRSRRDSSKDNEEVRRVERRGRRDESRDLDSKDRYSRTRRLSRSRSRSPTFDRVPVYRNAPGASSSPGSNNKGINSATNPPPPKYQTVLIEDILNQPGRTKRPAQIVIILRGIPGSGKTHVAKLIKDREVEMGGNAPRIVSLDDYFMTETEKVVKDPIKNTEVKETVMEYEYQPDMEVKYRNDLVKTFKKTIDQNFFPFIIVDSVNDQVKMFEHMVAYSTQKRFQVYIAEVEESVENCVKRNIHHRTKEQIQKIHRNWERTPSTCVKLDVRTLLQDEAVQDVEMEDVSDTENAEVVEVPKKVPVEPNWEEDESNNDESNSTFLIQSKWDKLEPSEEKLNRLDGLARKRTTGDDDKVDSLSVSIDSWLQSHLPEDYTTRQQTRPGQKRVRWADIEERRAQERMRDVGFVVGHTDWNRMTDPSFGSNALTKTKYI